jgi:hypothetical protein
MGFTRSHAVGWHRLFRGHSCVGCSMLPKNAYGNVMVRTLQECCSMKSSSRWFAGILLLTASAAANAIVRITPTGDGRDTVPVFVNGHGPYPFILDSGADSSAVYQWFARKEHFKVSRHETLSGQTGASEVAMYMVGDLAVDGGICATSPPMVFPAVAFRSTQSPRIFGH